VFAPCSQFHFPVALVLVAFCAAASIMSAVVWLVEDLRATRCRRGFLFLNLSAESSNSSWHSGSLSVLLRFLFCFALWEPTERIFCVGDVFCVIIQHFRFVELLLVVRSIFRSFLLSVVSYV
jgi:hypothetical protein